MRKSAFVVATLLLFVCSLSHAGSASSPQNDPPVQETTAGRDHVDELVLKLKSDSPTIRSEAFSALSRMGLSTVGPATALLQDKDPKVRQLGIDLLQEIRVPEAIIPLIRALEDSVPELRGRAGRYLQRYGPHAVLPLISALKHPDHQVRSQAAEQLGVLLDRRAVLPLILLLKDPFSEVRGNAASALGKIKDPHAVEALLPLLKDTDAEVREKVIAGIGSMEFPWVAGRLMEGLKDPSPRVRIKTISVLQELRTFRSDPYLNALKDPSAEVRATALWALYELRSDDPDKLRQVIPIIRDPDEKVRAAAVAVLGKIYGSHPDFKEALLQALADESVAVRVGAASSLSHSDDPALLLPFLAVLEKGKSDIRLPLIGWMNRKGIKDPRLVELLIASLSDPSESLRSAAVEGLRRIKDRRAIEPLKKIFNDRNPNVQVAVAGALFAIDPEAAQPIVAPFVDRMTEQLKHDNPEARKVGVIFLGQIQDPRSVGPLIKMLEDPQVGSEAAKALGKIGDTKAVGPLLKAYRGNFKYRTTIEALGKLGGSDALAFLLELVKKNEEGREAAIESLVAIGEPAAPFLIASLNHPEYIIRAKLCRALGQIGSVKAIEPLAVLFYDDPHEFVRNAARAALEKIGSPAVDTVLKGVKNENPVARRNMVKLLQKIKVPRTVPPVIALLNDPDRYVREAAAEALGEMNDPRAVEPLLHLLAEPEAGRIAGAALKTMTPSLRPQLMKAMQDKNPVVRKAALTFPEEHGNLHAYPYVDLTLIALHDEDAQVRGTALRQLKMVAFTLDPKPILPLLRDSDPLNRSEAAEILGKIGDPSATKGLCTASLDPDYYVRKASLEALSRIKDPQAVPCLITLLHTDKKIEAEIVITTLGAISDLRAVPPLIEALKEGVTPQMDVIQALGKLGDHRATAPLGASLKNQDWRIRMAAISALAAIKDQQAGALLIAILKDPEPEVRQRAARALGEIMYFKAIEPLSEIAKDQHSDLHRSAEEALYQITGKRL